MYSARFVFCIMNFYSGSWKHNAVWNGLTRVTMWVAICLIYWSSQIGQWWKEKTSPISASYIIVVVWRHCVAQTVRCDICDTCRTEHVENFSFYSFLNVNFYVLKQQMFSIIYNKQGLTLYGCSVGINQLTTGTGRHFSVCLWGSEIVVLCQVMYIEMTAVFHSCYSLIYQHKWKMCFENIIFNAMSVELKVYIMCGMNNVWWRFLACKLGNCIILERSSDFDSKGGQIHVHHLTQK